MQRFGPAHPRPLRGPPVVQGRREARAARGREVAQEGSRRSGYCSGEGRGRAGRDRETRSLSRGQTDRQADRDRQRDARPKPRTTIVVVWRTDDRRGRLGPGVADERVWALQGHPMTTHGAPPRGRASLHIKRTLHMVHARASTPRVRTCSVSAIFLPLTPSGVRG